MKWSCSIQSTNNYHFPCAMHCQRTWGMMGTRNGHGLCSHGAHHQNGTHLHKAVIKKTCSEKSTCSEGKGHSSIKSCVSGTLRGGGSGKLCSRAHAGKWDARRGQRHRPVGTCRDAGPTDLHITPSVLIFLFVFGIVRFTAPRRHQRVDKVKWDQRSENNVIFYRRK